MRQELWIALISTVGTIDPSLGYLNYRNLANSLQENFMGKIARQLQGEFKALIGKVMLEFCVEDDFSALHLGLAAPPRPSPGRTLLDLPAGQLLRIERMVQLLRELTEFNYNITYSEFDMERTYENCIIGYPEEVILCLADAEFIKLLFFLGERLVHVQSQAEDLFFRVLQVLQKVALCRLTLLSKPVKREFREALLLGINFLVRKVEGARFFEEVVDLNYKLITNVPLRKLRKIEQFQPWLQAIASLICQYLESTPFSQGLAADTIPAALELWRKMIISFTEPKLKDFTGLFSGLNSRVTWQLLQHVMRGGASPFAGLAFRKAKKASRAVQHFFGQVKSIVSYSLADLAEGMVRLVGEAEAMSVGQLGLLLLLGQGVLINPEFVEKINYLSDGECRRAMGKCMARLLQLVVQFGEKAQGEYPVLHQDIITLMFCENFLLNTVSRIVVSSEGPASCTSLIFREVEALVGQSYEWWVEKYLELILRALARDHRETTVYVLDIVHQFLLRLKFSLRKEDFRLLKVTGQLFDFLLQAAKAHFAGEGTVKLQRQLFLLIGLLGLDELLDNYNLCLDRVLGFIWEQKGDQLGVLYALRGVVESLDQATIFRRFVVKSKGVLASLTKGLFQDQPLAHSVAVLKLVTGLLENKSCRLSNHKNQRLAYQLMTMVLGCYSELTERVRFTLEARRGDGEAEVKLALQMWRGWLAVLKGNYLNYYMVRVLWAGLPRLLARGILLVQQTAPLLRLYPKARKASLAFLCGVAENLLHFLLETDLPELYAVLWVLFEQLAGFVNEQALEMYSADRTVVQNEAELEVARHLEILARVLQTLHGLLQEQHDSEVKPRVDYFVRLHHPQLLQLLHALFCNCFQLQSRARPFAELCACLSCLFVLLRDSAEAHLRDKLQGEFSNPAALASLAKLAETASPDDRGSEAFKAAMKELIRTCSLQHVKIEY